MFEGVFVDLGELGRDCTDLKNWVLEPVVKGEELKGLLVEEWLIKEMVVGLLSVAARAADSVVGEDVV